MGFWLGRCKEALMIPHSSIDPARLREGLPFILWHRPNDLRCPDPFNLQNELPAKGLSNRPLVVCLEHWIKPREFGMH